MHVHTWVFSRNNNQQYPRMTAVFKHSCEKQGLPCTVHEMPTPPRTNRIIWADDNHFKLMEWARVVTEATPGDLLLISDSDMMCMKLPTEDMFSHVTSVAFTKRDPRTSGNIPVNAGMVVVRAGEKATEFFNEWVRRDTVLYDDHAKWTPFKRKYAGMNQASLGWMMEDPVWNAKVQWLECNTMNMVKPWRGWSEAYFIHVKSGLRKCIFSGLRLDAPEELVRHWRNLEKEIGGTGEPEISQLPTYKQKREAMATRFRSPTQHIQESQRRTSAVTALSKQIVKPERPAPTPSPRGYRARRAKLMATQSKSVESPVVAPTVAKPSQTYRNTLYIDLGANEGKTIANWLREHPGSTVEAFEPTPALAAKLRTKFASFPNVNIHEAAVSTTEGTANFYLGDRSNQSSTLREDKEGPWTVKYDKPVTVKTIDFPVWLKELDTDGRTVVIKMDVEGEEYKLLPAMIANGTLQGVSELRVEYHLNKFASVTEEEHNKVRAAVEAVVPKVVLWK